MAKNVASSRLTCTRGIHGIYFALALILTLLISASSLAQSATNSIQATITDQNNAVISGARVRLRPKTLLGAEREVTSDDQGQFTFSGVQPGDYTLVIDKQGFLTAEHAVTTATGDQSLSLTLSPAPVSDSVTVIGTDSAVETTLKLPTTLHETPRSLTIIDAARIREQNFKYVNDALAYVPGISVNSYRTGGYHFYSRGYRMQPEDTRVDGFAGINASGGFGASLFGVEQVVLLRGPAGLLYGSSSAPGGLVNLITKKPQDVRTTRIDLRTGGYAGNGVGLGDRGSMGFDLDSTGPLTQNGRVLYRTLFTIENMNYFTNGVLDRNRFANSSLTFKLDEEGRYTFTPLVQWARQNRPAGGGIVISPSTSLATNDGVSGPVKTSDLSLPDVNLSAGGRIDRTVLTGFDFRANPADAWRINGSYRYINFGTEIDRFTPQVSSAAQLNQLRTENAVQRVQSKSEIERRYHNFDVNATYEMRQAGWWKNITQVGVHQRLAETRSTIAAGAVPGPQSAINIYTGRATSPLIANFPALIWGNLSEINFLNGYVQNRTSLADGRWVVTLGLGYGRNTVDGETRQGDLTPNAALVFNVNKRLALYTSYATSYNPNDVDAEDASGRRAVFGPTQGVNYEVGAKYDFLNRKLSSTLSLFHNKIDNALVQSGPTDFNPNGNRYFVEAGTRRSRGAEVTLEAQPTQSWHLTGAVSYLDAIYTGEAPASALATAAIPGSRAEKSPRWSYNLWNRYDRAEGTLKGFGAGLGLTWQDERLGGNGARTRIAPDPLLLPSFTRVDAALFYRLNDRVDFSLNFENMLNNLIFVSGTVGSGLEIAAPRTVSFRTGYRF